MKLFLTVMCLLGLGACQSEHSELDPESTWGPESEWLEKGPLRAKVSLRHEHLSILDQQDFRLEVQAPAGMRLTFPAFQERLEDFRQVPWRPDDEETTPAAEEQASQLHLTRYLRFEVFESGEQSLPPFRVIYSTGFGANLQTGYLDTPSLLFNIESIDDPALVNAPIERDENLRRPAPFPWFTWSIWIGLVILSFTGIVWAWSRYQSMKDAPPPPPEPAHSWAWRAIEQLVKRQKENEISNEEFLNHLTLILRNYIERRFDIHAPEQTTEEFLSQGVRQHGALSNHSDVLTQFLEYADLIKFAGQDARTEDVQQSFDFLKQFIDETREEAS
jgi:hypothetical protein